MDPSVCLVFEDSAFGVQAAKTAGMKVGMFLNLEKFAEFVVAVPDPSVLSANKELYQKADLILHSLEEIQLELFNLPSWSS